MMGLLEPTAGVIQRDLGARFALVNQARPPPQLDHPWPARPRT